MSIVAAIPYHLVRCLDCSRVYEKPAAGGTLTTNPGCPTCACLGWRPVSTAGGPPPRGGPVPASGAASRAPDVGTAGPEQRERRRRRELVLQGTSSKRRST